MKIAVILAVPVALTGLWLAQSSAAPLSSAAPEPYVPGVGDIMSGVQSSHAKLWFAGEAKNWALAAYEQHEIGEGFDDVGKLHPKFEDNPTATTQAITQFASPPLTRLEKSIAAKDESEFQSAYDALTAACNTCHQTYQHEFIQVIRPTKSPFSNQNFQPK